MIKKMYFIDGQINNSWPIPETNSALAKNTRISYVDAGYGYSFNQTQLEYFQALPDAQIILVTNQIAALSFKWFDIEGAAEVKELIYLFSKKKMCWMPLESFTTRELRAGHNLEHLYKTGEFFEDVDGQK